MHTARRYFRYLRPYLGHMAIGSLALAIAGALMAAVVATLKPLVNALSGRPAETDSPVPPDMTEGWPLVEEIGTWLQENQAFGVPLLIVGVFALRGFCLYVGNYFVTASGARVIRDLRSDLHQALVDQSVAFFRTHTTGSVLSRVLNDVQRLQRISTSVLADTLRLGFMTPFMLVVILIHDWRASLFALGVLLIMAIPTAFLSRRLRRASRRSQESLGEAASLLKEAVSGIKVVQSFGMERFEVKRFRAALDRLLSVDLKAARAAALSPSINEVIGATAGAVLLLLATLAISEGQLRADDFAVVITGLGTLFIAMRQLTRFNIELQQALAALERIFEVLDHPPEVRDAPGAVELPPFTDRVRFEQVDFSYGDEQVLFDVHQTLEKGEMVALVGPSGSGKSTLANLLPRFLDVTGGRVTIDGRDLRQVSVASLRRQVGLVTQETVLFDDTVRANIAYGRSDIPLEKVQKAAAAAYAASFIEALPEGYETRLGEHGLRLSAGQRQRIAIARALLKDPPILILDEATSALDTESEARVQAALDVLLQGRTSLVIAHRLSTVRQADRILVLDAGRVVEEGSHAELLAAGGLYAHLYHLQLAPVGDGGTPATP